MKPKEHMAYSEHDLLDHMKRGGQDNFLLSATQKDALLNEETQVAWRAVHPLYAGRRKGGAKKEKHES
jgi:hypothetical protein